MHEYESDHRNNVAGPARRMYDIGGTGAGRARDAAALREGHAQGLHGLYRFPHQERAAKLFLQLASVALLAILLAGCTSSGNPQIEERNADLVCSAHETKVCPGAVGTASRIRKDQGACYCSPREHIGN